MIGRLVASIVSIALVVCLLKLFVVGTPLEEARLLGMTEREVRAEYGKPFQIRDFDPADNKVKWLYAHGILGVASLVEFEDGVVVAVLVSYGK